MFSHVQVTQRRATTTTTTYELTHTSEFIRHFKHWDWVWSFIRKSLCVLKSEKTEYDEVKKIRDINLLLLSKTFKLFVSVSL